MELSEFEFVVRGHGYLRGIPDLRKIVLKNDGGTPVLLEDVARIELGPDERRGLTELNGDGEVASGIVLQRFGANALEVIDNVKNRLAELAGSLPRGVDIQTVYDRSALIRAAIENLRHTLLEEGLIVALVCFLFLLHVRSALVAILMLPVGVLMAFAAMKALSLGSNIMSLGGIAIAIGAMVDAAIVMIENAHKHLERAQPGTPRVQILIAAASEVGPALFFSLLIITVSFLPIFSLEAQEGRLFKPLAYTKTFSMAAAALLSVTLVPALMIVFVRGRIIPEQKNPLNRFLIWLYRPIIKTVLGAKTLTILLALALVAVTVWPASQIGLEFMPTLNEGTLFYMPTTLPGISVTKAADLLQMQDRIIKSFPEVESVFGKAGRASTATDPAPTEMYETVINLKPKEQWRPGMTIDSPDRGNGQGAAVSRRVERLDHADQGAHRHAIDRHPHSGRRQGVRHRSRRDGKSRPPNRTDSQNRSWHLKRLRRAGDWRLLPQHRCEPRRTCPLWPDGGRRAGDRCNGAGGPSDHHHR